MLTDTLAANLRERKQQRDKLFTELQNLEARERVLEEPDEGLTERIGRINTGISKADDDVREMEAEYGRAAAQDQRIRELATDPRNTEAGATFDTPRDQARDQSPVDRAVAQDRDLGLRAIERHKDALSAPAADRLDELVRRGAPARLDARYLDAVGDPDYFAAFGKMVTDPTTGHLRFTAREVEAVRKVSQVEAERALSTTGASGGFAVPFTLDPSVMLSSDGALNPVRQLARVITVSTHDWKGVSSAGVTASYVAEATAATDASPTLAQPTISTQQWRAFVPFSIEIGQDWSGLQQELLRLCSDGRDVLDATKFLTGTGTNEPFGIFPGLTTTQRVQTNTVATYAVGDPWLLKAGMPARFIGNATFAANPSTWDTTYRFVGGNSTEPLQMPTRDGEFLGRPKVEWSTMATGTTTGTKLIIGGDFNAGYTIADRLGITAELIPHLFGAAQGNLPTGQRGLYVYGRTGANVVVQNAFRYLEVK